MTTKTTTILIYLTLTTLLILLLLSSSPSSRRPHRRLKLRPHPRIPFDPIVASLDRRLDDRHWHNRTHLPLPPPAPGHESAPDWDDLLDPDDYVNDEARFNLTDRIAALFPAIDRDSDGFLTVAELGEWNKGQAVKEEMHRTERDMEVHDRDRDGFVGVAEFEPPAWARHLEGSNSSDPNVGWWKAEHFNASDVDDNGLLNLTEFNDFLHPADSDNPKLISWLCKEEIRIRDKDRDGKLNFNEFFHGLFDSVRDYSDIQGFSDSGSSMEESAKKLFAQLDKDSDGLLSEEEVKPVLESLHPSDRFYAKQQADHMISEADIDKDGRVSLKEAIENPYVFYSAIFTEEDEYHDEFR